MLTEAPEVYSSAAEYSTADATIASEYSEL